MSQRHHARQPSQGRKVLPPHARPNRPPPLTSRKSYNNGQGNGHGHGHSHSTGQAYLSSSKASGPGWSKRIGAESHGATDDEEEFGMASFLQFCATCERQIVTPNASILYCSEACRRRDSRPTSLQEIQSIQQSIQSPPPVASTSSYFDQAAPEIIPQMSPTVLRPVSQTFEGLSLDETDSTSEHYNSHDDRRDSKYLEQFHSDFSAFANAHSPSITKTHRPRTSRTSTTGNRGDSSTNLPSLSHSPSSSYGTVASNASYRPVIRHNPFSTTSMSTKSIELVIPYPTESASPTQLLKDASLKSTASTLTSFRVAEANDISYQRKSPSSRPSSRGQADNTLRQLFSHDALKSSPKEH